MQPLQWDQLSSPFGTAFLTETYKEAPPVSIYKPGRPNKYNPTLGLEKNPPSKAGEYYIRNSAGSLIYIGEACNLARRMGEHIRSGKLPTEQAGGTTEWKVADDRSTFRTRQDHECIEIAQHAPILHRS